ncbi:MAG TPA: GDSL-type esterase/lipase family protein [Roseiflexaceae bacterium]|nr:GDSL-type esterase/lipase family protein [Roseiflexaceae bacterium]
MSLALLRLLLCAALALLVASLVLNVVLLLRARSFERAYNAERLLPFGPDPGQPPARSAALRLVLLGDSRARQWGSPPLGPRFEVLNRGVDGQTAAQALLRFDRQIAPLRPDIVVIQVGVNDLVASAESFPAEHGLFRAGCIDAIAALVHRTRASGATVVLTTIFPIGPPTLQQRILPTPDIAGSIDTVNAALVALAGDGVLVLDTQPLLADPRGVLRPEYRVDRLHLSAAGYAALSPALARLLEEIAPVH